MLNLAGFEAKQILEKLTFLCSVNNSSFMRLFIPEDGSTSNIPNVVPTAMVHPVLMDLFRTLSALQDQTGCKIMIPENAIIDENTIGDLLYNARLLLQISEYRIISAIDKTYK